MSGSNDLTTGNITSKLIRLAIPLIATNFIQTAYNLVDMIWIGRLGSKAVIAVGTASFFINMALALSTLVITGASIHIAQSYGSKDYKKMKQFITNGYLIAFILAIIYSTIIIFFRYQIIDFFNIDDIMVKDMAVKYLFISMFGIVFMFFNTLFASIMNSLGNSKLSFRLNSVGFLINIVLDPILIFGVGGFFKLGVMGAAIATIIGRIIVFILSVIKGKQLVSESGNVISFNFQIIKDIMKLGFPYTIQRVAFIGIAIIMARIISTLSPTGIGVQKIGLQIESLSYMTIGGLNGAVIAFVGQNFGANNMKRIKKGYKVSIIMSLLFGLLTSVVFIVFAEQIFKIFISDRLSINMGISYLRIIGLSQAFMCAEIVTKASFNGVGKTYIPAIVSLIFTGLRIPIAIYLSTELGLKVDGIWWSISVSSIFKGTLLVLLFIIYLNRYKNNVSRNITKLN